MRKFEPRQPRRRDRGMARALPAILVLAGVAAHTAPAWAQIEEVVVTAQKRPQRIQDVAQSITAVTSRQIEAFGYEGIEGYARGIPGLSFTADRPGETRFALRGIPNLSGSGATVSLYMDETPLTTDDVRSGAADPAIFDVARIEVLRGPQGTLYGASSMGGTIRIIQNQPRSDRFEAKAHALMSSFSRGSENYGGDAVLNVPLVEGKAAMRINAYYRHLGGFIDRVADPALLRLRSLDAGAKAALASGQSDIDSANLRSARLSLLLTPTDALKVTLALNGFDNRYSNVGQFDTRFGKQRLAVATAQNEPKNDSARIASLTAEYDLGPAKLISASSWVQRSAMGTTDFTRLLSGIFGDALVTGFNTASNPRNFSQELRLTSNDTGPLRWIGGVYYNRFSEAASVLAQTPGFSQALGLTGANAVARDLFFKKDAYKKIYETAVFGEVTYQFTDALSATAGIRRYEGRSKFRDQNDGFLNGGLAPATFGAVEYSGTNPKAVANYKLDPDHMVYASAAKGYRPGGGNYVVPTAVCAADLAALGLSSSPKGFNPDTLWSYELGSKNSFLNDRVVVNATGYLIRWSQIQLQQALQCGFNYRTNGGKASSRGGELEVTLRPVDGLELTGGLGYVHSRLDEASRNIAGSVAGSPVPGVPEMTWNVGAIYRRPVADGLTASFGADYHYTGAFRTNLAAPSASNTRERVYQTNLNLSVEGSWWEAGVFIKNAFNSISVIGAASSPDGATFLTVTPPRQVGAQVRAKF